MSCSDESITCPRAPITMMRSCTGPGGALNDAAAPEAAEAGAALDAGDDGADDADGGAAPVPGISPRNSGRPSGAVAVSITLAAVVSDARLPAACATGSHAKVTRAPFASRSVPIQN